MVEHKRHLRIAKSNSRNLLMHLPAIALQFLPMVEIDLYAFTFNEGIRI
jgi:hypothetical protein